MTESRPSHSQEVKALVCVPNSHAQVRVSDSFQSGWQLHHEAGRKKVILELGGNAPCIIDETNHDRLQHVAQRLMFGSFYYSGYTYLSLLPSLTTIMQSELYICATDLCT